MKKLIKLLFGRGYKANWKKIKNSRTITIEYPGVEGENGGEGYKIEFRGDDGILMYILKRFDSIERQLRMYRREIRHQNNTTVSPNVPLIDKLD